MQRSSPTPPVPMAGTPGSATPPVPLATPDLGVEWYRQRCRRGGQSGRGHDTKHGTEGARLMILMCAIRIFHQILESRGNRGRKLNISVSKSRGRASLLPSLAEPSCSRRGRRIATWGQAPDRARRCGSTRARA